MNFCNDVTFLTFFSRKCRMCFCSIVLETSFRRDWLVTSWGTIIYFNTKFHKTSYKLLSPSAIPLFKQIAVSVCIENTQLTSRHWKFQGRPLCPRWLTANAYDCRMARLVMKSIGSTESLSHGFRRKTMLQTSAMPYAHERMTPYDTETR